MKKFLAITLALSLIFSIGVFSFAAAEEVTGTLADGTAISKPVSEVVKTVEEGLAALDAEKADALKAFFAEAEVAEGKEVIAKGIVDFGGAFADAAEAEIEVPLAVPGVKAGDKVGVSLSSGTSKTVEATEDGSVTVAFPKDADGIGYVVSSEKEKSTWDWPLPPEPVEEEEPEPEKKWDRVRIEETPYGNVTVYENLDENGNVIESLSTGTLTYEDGSTDTFTDTYKKNEDGTTTETSNGTYHDASGYTVDYSNTNTTNPDGSGIEQFNNTYTEPDGTTHNYSETATTQADGTSKVETNYDGNTETHYYDADHNEIFPSPEW